VCDALLVATPGKLTFDIMRELVDAGLVVSDDEVKSAMRFAFRDLKLVLEPGGAAALAAVLAEKIDFKGKTTAVVLSGGNVDVELFSEIQAESA
jgi:threonine dehydratase